MTIEIERFLPGMNGRMAYEHRHRYLWAREFVAGGVVLDIACGEGYGSSLLADCAKRVVGLDIDAITVARAKTRYGAQRGIEFVEANCIHTPFPDAVFDVVVSFETIEHIAEQEQFVAEMRRVLKPGGLLLISTPNRKENLDATGRNNPFHVKELYEDEFRALLQNSFAHVRLMGQRFLMPSLLAPLCGGARSEQLVTTFVEGGATESSVSSTLVERPNYFVAMCRDCALDAISERASLYFDIADDLWQDQEQVLRWASGVHDETERLKGLLRERDAGPQVTGFDPARLCQITESVLTAGAILQNAQSRSGVASGPIQLFSASLADKIDRLQSINEEASQYREEMVRAQAEANTLRAQIKDIVFDLEAARKARTHAEDALNDARAALCRSEKNSDRLFAEVGELARQHDIERTEAQERHDMVLAKLSQAVDLSKAHNMLTALYDAAQTRLGRLVQEREDLDNEMAALRRAFERQKEDAEAAHAAADSLRATRREERRANVLQLTALERWSDAARVNETALGEVTRHARIVNIRRKVLGELAAASMQARRRIGKPSWRLEVVGAHLEQQPPAAPTRALRWKERRNFERRLRFDAEWYLNQNPDIATRKRDPRRHYLDHGLREDRDPHPFFSACWYRRNAQQPVGDVPAYAHFLAVPERTTWAQHPLFDADYYVARHRDLGLQTGDALDHFLSKGARELLDPHPLVDMMHLSSQPGFQGSDNVLLDYLVRVELHGASPHPLFDGDFYLIENPDVASAEANPLLHYIVNGWREGRQPHPLFAGDWYLSSNPDVLSAGAEPLRHYVLFGAEEGRKPHPLFDPDYYLEQAGAAHVARREALSHYLFFGAPRRTNTTRDLTVEEMQAHTPNAAWRRFDPITAFMRQGPADIEVPQHYVRGAEAGGAPQLVWPPTPRPAYWLPQGLRNYIIDRFGESATDLYVYLMSVVERMGDDPDAFAESRDLHILRERMEMMAEARSRKDAPIDVSIIIPVYNNLVFTLTSVVSILDHRCALNYEIIIGDDQSKDATPRVFGEVAGTVRLVRHEKNLGFLGNCNACAAQAQGRYVVMLNNDTLVLPGWLDELIAPFAADPSVGFTGSKLINGDGTLQEAGGIFWKDGSAWNFGRNSDPRRPEFNYLKDVDYVSGASIALPRDLWEELGGFDSVFTPAYCEDSDIAFRVRALGRRTVYAPHSELIHHEGKSHGRDTSSGIKAHQVANSKTLLERWKSTLEAENFSNAEHVFLARDRSANAPHILIVDHYIPQWDRDAGSRTIYHFIRMFLSKGFKITLWPENLYEDKQYCKVLQNMGVEVIYSSEYVGKFVDFISENGKYFGYALLSRPSVAINYYSMLRNYSKAKILYYGHDIHHRRMQLEMETHPSNKLELEIEAMRIEEVKNWRSTDVVLYPSEEECRMVVEELPGAVVAPVPMLGYTSDELLAGRANLARFDKRDVDDLLFVGGSHPPNVDALLWFTHEVFPLIRERRSTVRLNIVGSSVHDEVRRLASESIVICGRLSDDALNLLYAKVGVAVVPLRFGAGVKGKTIEALFNAIPFVATSIGMQGLRSDTPIGFVADSAQEFAEAVLQAQSDREEARNRVLHGLDFIEEKYSIGAMEWAFSPFVSELKASSFDRGFATREGREPEPSTVVEGAASEAEQEKGEPQ